MLPPGRARLLHVALATGSAVPVMTIGIVDVACFSAGSAWPERRRSGPAGRADQLGGQRGKALGLALAATRLGDEILAMAMPSSRSPRRSAT